jgi:hypothetical protein
MSGDKTSAAEFTATVAGRLGRMSSVRRLAVDSKQATILVTTDAGQVFRLVVDEVESEAT